MKSEDKVGYFAFVGKIMHVAYIMAAILLSYFACLSKQATILFSSSSLPIAVDVENFGLLGKWVLGQGKQKNDTPMIEWIWGHYV